MLKTSFFDMNTHTETYAPLNTSVIDDTLFKTMIRADTDQALLQFMDVMNLVDLLLHFCSSFVVKLVQICAVGCQSMVTWKQNLDWYLLIQEVDCLSRLVSSSRSNALLENKEYGKDLTHL